MKKFWIIAWIVLYGSVVSLGFTGEPTVFSRIVGLAFFLPPTVLLCMGVKEKNRRLIRGVRIVAITFLVLTTVILVATMLSAVSKKDLDRLMEVLLILGAAPLLCFKSWLVSLFGWALLFSGSYVAKKS